MKKKYNFIIWILCIIPFLMAALVFYNPSKSPKILTVANKSFAIPNSFAAGIDELGSLNFYLNAKTLQQEEADEENDLIRVYILPKENHPGSFFLREQAVKLSECKYKTVEDYKVCEYQDEDRGRVQLYYKEGNLILINNCTLHGTETSLNPTCQTWGPFLDNLKIAYSYSEKFHQDILHIDNAVKHMLINFYKNAGGV